MTMWKWSQSAADNDDVDATINWLEGQAPSSVNNSARAVMAAVAKYRDDTSGMITTAGGTTAYTLTTYQSLSTLTDGHTVAFTVNATNTGTSTLNVDSLGAVALEKIKGTALAAGELVAGCVYTATYDSASTAAWVIHGGRNQNYDAELAAIAGLTSAADKGIQFTGSGTAAVYDLTTAGKALLDDADASAQRTTLGLTTVATSSYAAKSDMETATSTTTVVPPGLVQNHPGVAKAWALVTVSGGTPTLTAGYNVTSVSDGGIGIYTLNLTTAFSSANFAAVVTPFANGSNLIFSQEVSAKTASTIVIRIYEASSGSNSNLEQLDCSFMAVAFGDQ